MSASFVARTVAIVKGEDRGAFPYLLLLPAAVVLAGFLVYPLVSAVRLSFYNYSFLRSDVSFVGIENYKVILTPVFWQVLSKSFIWTFGSIVAHFLLGMTTGLVFNVEFRGRGILRSLILVPWVVSGVAAAYIWRWMLNPMSGLVNEVLVRIGLSSVAGNWLGANRAMFSIILANSWKGFPLWMLMILAGLQNIPVVIREAAKVDGANALKQFLYITLPYLKKTLVVTAILDFIWTFNFFELVSILTGGGPGRATMIMPVYIYNMSFLRFSMSKACAISVFQTAFMVIVMLIAFPWLRHRQEGM